MKYIVRLIGGPVHGEVTEHDELPETIEVPTPSLGRIVYRFLESDEIRKTATFAVPPEDKAAKYSDLLQLIQGFGSILTYPERPDLQKLYQACREMEREGWLTSERLPGDPARVMFKSVV